MLGKNRNQNQGNFFWIPLRCRFNPRHELHQLVHAIECKKFEGGFASLYLHTVRPPAPVRLMLSQPRKAGLRFASGGRFNFKGQKVILVSEIPNPRKTEKS